MERAAVVCLADMGTYPHLCDYDDDDYVEKDNMPAYLIHSIKCPAFLWGPAAYETRFDNNWRTKRVGNHFFFPNVAVAEIKFSPAGSTYR